MNNIDFSVSMCVYGKDNVEHFKTAVESILNQTCPPQEIVLVVDGPVPQELDSIVRLYEDTDTFKVVRFAENQGHGNARRAGLEACTNDMVAIMDADDISVPNRFELQLAAFANNPGVSVVGGIITEFIDTPENIVAMREVPSTDNDIKEYMKKRCPMNLVTVMFKKSDVEAVGGFLDWYCDEDYYLWLRMALAGMQFANLHDTVVNVRIGKEMYRRRGGLRYFKSEAKLQKYMLDNKIIGYGLFLMNVAKRLIVQVLMPNYIRGLVFKKFARKSVHYGR